jgi:membrane protease YdiL (CAAX protease family)
MNHLASAFTGKNNAWRYIIMLVAILVVSNTIGSVPLLIPFFKALAGDPSIAGRIAQNPSDFSPLGVSPYYSLFMMLFPFLASFIAFMLLVKPLHSRTFIQTVNGTAKIRWSHYFISFFVWLSLSAIYLFAYIKADPGNFTLSNTSISLLYVALISVLLIPFQAGLEEIVFRGYLMQGFAVAARNAWLPLLVTSILFALLHGVNPEVKEYGFMTMMPQYLVFGLIFGLVTLFDDGIEAAMGAHAANNIFLVIMVTQESSALQSPALYVQNTIHPWTEFTGLLVSGILFILILKLIFRWKDFSRIKQNLHREPQRTTEGHGEFV